ncbi:hypothetical protein SAMN04487771_100312 [[Clostridium] aminophilum]|uniref:Tellurite resistance protein TerB n=1 Tax=[Clostridium] aminophilum TaxID=1526 RepID=A0A1I0AXF8_9FIRM|nr:hypothetical protein [[Clostridium] aminophilum]SES99080.1 hypothetical protein SAMN04487771_100312 [[Clostridium] aminophilum]
MYLSMLNSEKKHLFLNLEIYLSKVDSDFSDAEKLIIDAHCMEMHIDNNNYDVDMTQSEVFDGLKKLTLQERKIVFLELVGTIMADNVYHEGEKRLVKKLAEILGMTDADIDLAFSIIADMKNVYERCADYIK